MKVASKDQVSKDKKKQAEDSDDFFGSDGASEKSHDGKKEEGTVLEADKESYSSDNEDKFIKRIQAQRAAKKTEDTSTNQATKTGKKTKKEQGEEARRKKAEAMRKKINKEGKG